MNLKVVVTGTGRSGTVYMARLLTAAGMMCGHESIFDFNGIEGARERLSGLKEIQTSHCSRHEVTQNPENWWREKEPWYNPQTQVAESSYCTAPYLTIPELADTRIVHVVRNPWHVAKSWINAEFFTDKQPGFQPWNRFIESHLPGFMNWSTIEERTCDYYVRWNRMIDAYGDRIHCKRFRLEDQPSRELGEYLELPGLHEVQLERNINTWGPKHRPFTADQLPDGKLKQDFLDIVRDYGY